MIDYHDIYYLDHGDFYGGVLSTQKEHLRFESDGAVKKVNLQISDIKNVNYMYMANGLGVRLTKKDGSIVLFSGFSNDDYKRIGEFFKEKCGMNSDIIGKCLLGQNDGVMRVPNDSSILNFSYENQQIFDIPLECVSNVTSSKNEIGLIFHTTEKAQVSLVEMRLHIDPNSNPDRNADILTREMTEIITKKCDIASSSNNLFTELEEVNCLVPRGKYNLKLFDAQLHLYGKSYDFKVPYRSIVRLFLIQSNDKKFHYFVINVDPPLRQGQTRHAYVVIHLDNNQRYTLTLNNQQESNKKNINKIIASLEDECDVDGTRITGKSYHVLPNIISEITDKKLITTKKYKSLKNCNSFICSHKASTGFLFPLDIGFLYLHKPTLYIRNAEISGITFKRGTDGSRTFDVEFTLKGGQSVTFSSIEKEEYTAFYDHIVSKNITIRNTTVTKAVKSSVVDDESGSDLSGQDNVDVDESESNDEDFDPNAKSADPEEEASLNSYSSSNESYSSENDGSQSGDDEEDSE